MEKTESNTDKTSTTQNTHLNEYEQTVNTWITAYQQWQKATSDAIKMYAEGIQRSAQTNNTDAMKKYHQLWQEGWNLSGKNDLSSWYLKSWENVWKDLGYGSPKAYADYWKDMYEKYNKTMTQNFQEVIHSLKQQNVQKSA
ncbi:MAG: hypothetical protein OEM77_09395 [Nitrosopumilus sp.]|nr:hypothetical protein [Nitrosopumilus sp.]MDH3736761.1 hypothetical protein [Nitrosopumilus sp.]MDH3822981.1 hypothetical protein [Nitrosopumilus sp.]MDH3833680.1 hypothetical protein [Nitrosopumilus sp.]